MNRKIRELIEQDIEVIRQLRLGILIRLGVIRPVRAKTRNSSGYRGRRF